MAPTTATRLVARRFGRAGALAALGSIVSVLAAAGTGAAADPSASVVPSLAPVEAKVAIVAGGPHPYFGPVPGAVADAIADFNMPNLVFVFPPAWELAAQNQLIESLVAQGYNAFAINATDAAGTNATIDELDSKGIPVIDIAGCTVPPTKAKFCLATDTGNSAYLGTKALIEAMGGSGNIVSLTGFITDPNTKLRQEGVQKAVDETNGAVTLLQTVTDIDTQEAADKAISSLLAARLSEIDGIISTAYVPTVVAATALTTVGDKRIKMVGIDDDPIVIKAITDGYITGTMYQNPYGQAYIGAYAVRALLQGCTMKPDAPFLIDSGTGFISASNVTTYVDERKAFTKQLAQTFLATYMDCPA